jgi:hypothetical protein
LHVACTVPMARAVDKLLADLKDCVAEVCARSDKAPDGAMRWVT